tara:strand:+ start:24 stop:1214 length:1191 start_codon:yes stop_codon:yes gene_type:complete
MQVDISISTKQETAEHLMSHKVQHWFQIGLKLHLWAIVVLFALFKTTKVQAQVVDIGDISELNGSAQIVRDKPYEADLKFAIQSNDEAITTNGRMAITFLDESTVKLTEHSQLLIDEYIYDPDPSKSKMALTFGLGTARFITGNLNRIDKQNISLKTPTANIAIRGTDFTATVDELGRSLIILLPDAFGLSSGEIEVVTAMGTVILNKPYEATTVSVFESAPTKPVILDLSLDIIDNMLIVTPPKEDNILEEESASAQANSVLDFNDLDIDYLAEDYLQDDSLEFTELDINYLDVNFLEDLLDVLDELDVQEDEDQLVEATSTQIVGTLLGKDPDTQIITLIQGDVITLQRSVSESVKLDINTSGSYTVIFIQDGISNVVKINGGGDSVITIRQSN